MIFDEFRYTGAGVLFRQVESLAIILDVVMLDLKKKRQKSRVPTL